MTTITFHSDNTSRQRREAMMFGLLRVAAGTNILALVGVCVFLLWNGSPAISWEFLTEPPAPDDDRRGRWPCIVGTFLLAFGAMLIAFPLGVASAVYLHEYGGKGRYTRYLRLGISNLAGVPSVVFGLFGLAFFVTFLGMGVSLLAGVLTLAVLHPAGHHQHDGRGVEAGSGRLARGILALGATRSQTIARVVLPRRRPRHVDPGPFSVWPALLVKLRRSCSPPPCFTRRRCLIPFSVRSCPSRTICMCLPQPGRKSRKPVLSSTGPR